MSEGSFDIFTKVQDFKVILEGIQGEGGKYSPILRIPVEFTFRPLSWNGNNGRFIVTLIKAKLSSKEIISEITEITDIKVLKETERNIHFLFPLPTDKLYRIEKYRNGNLMLNLNLQVQVCTLGTQYQPNMEWLSNFEVREGKLTFNIEQSQWVNRVLPNVGYGTFRIIELPLQNNIFPKEYSQSVTELQEAQKYLINGDTDKVVAHCRTALEPFKSRLQELKEHIRSDSQFEWIKNISIATEEWLDKILKSTYTVTHKTHHVPSVGHFSKQEAEIIMMFTIAIISYIGEAGFIPGK